MNFIETEQLLKEIESLRRENEELRHKLHCACQRIAEQAELLERRAMRDDAP